MILAKVSYGIFTLTGTSQAKGQVLAAMEVGEVDDVKTVLNDLDFPPAIQRPPIHPKQTQWLTNPRRIFEDVELKKLVEHPQPGVLSALLVWPSTNQSFEIIAGARRYRAATIAELFDECAHCFVF